MKIAYFLDIFYPEINGVITSTVNLAENLIKRGHKIYFITPKKENFKEPVVHGNIPVFYIPSVKAPLYPDMRFNLPWSRIFDGYIEKERFDIFHITSPWLMGWLAIHYGKKHNIPIVQTFHTMITEPHYVSYVVKSEKLIPLSQKILWWYIGRSLKNSDYITAPSEYAKNEILKKFPELTVEQISNGVDLEKFKHYKSFEETKKEYPFLNRESFIYVGRLGKEKSIDILIKAMGELVKKYPEAHLIIVGDGPEKEKLQTLTNELKLTRNVTFTGKIPHDKLIQSGLIHHSHCFVTASTSENQSMTVIETLLCNTPPLVANVDGMRDIVNNENALFSPFNYKELAELMHKTLVDKTFYEALKKRTNKNAEQYDGMKIAERFEQIYTELLNNKKRQAEAPPEDKKAI